jgi:Mrp family chromosome partitioning ATPase/capsular polysaccharide biosynthesis protein
LKRYFPSMKRYAWTVAVCLVVTTLVGIIIAKSLPPAYQATATMLVDAGAPGTTYPGQNVNSTDSISQAANDSAEIVTLGVMQYVYSKYPELKAHHFTPLDLTLDVTVTAPSTTTSFFTVTATAPKPADAVMIANDVANGYVQYKTDQAMSDLTAKITSLKSQINTLEGQKQHWESLIASLPSTSDPHYTIYNNDLTDVTHNIDTLTTTLQGLPTSVKADVFVSAEALPATVTQASKSTEIIGVMFLAGLVLGLLVMIILVSLDGHLYGEDLVKEKLGLAYLGGLSKQADIKSVLFRPTGEIAQEYADICANLRLTRILPGQWQAPQGVALLVTSPQVAEGKSTVVAAIASTVARGGGTVVVVDGNLRHPSTHLTFGINPGGIGLSGLLKAPAGEPVDAVVQRSNTPNIWLVSSGPAMEDPSFVLGQKFPAILSQLRKKTDLVLIEGPALLENADAALLATMVDGVAVVMNYGNDKMSLLLRAKEILTSLAHVPAGIIMNRQPKRKQNRYFATAMPAETLKEEWAALAVSTNGNGHSNGNGNGNGHSAVPRPEPPVVAPSPAPQAAPVAVPPPTPGGVPLRPGSLPSLPGMVPLQMPQLPVSPRRPDMSPPVRPGNE